MQLNTCIYDVSSDVACFVLVINSCHISVYTVRYASDPIHVSLETVPPAPLLNEAGISFAELLGSGCQVHSPRSDKLTILVC